MLAAPAIVHAGNLMPIKALVPKPLSMEDIYEHYAKFLEQESKRLSELIANDIMKGNDRFFI